MLIKQISYFAIRTTVSDYDCKIREYFDTIESAWSHRYDYGDWYVGNGFNTIIEYGNVNGRIDVVNEWKVKRDSWSMTIKDGVDLPGYPKLCGTGCPGRENFS